MTEEAHRELPQEYYAKRDPRLAHGAQPEGRRDAAAAQVAAGWQWYYAYHADPADGGARYAAGVHAYKQALIDTGLGTGIDLAVPVWGSSARQRCKEFQLSQSLDADGVVGPHTGRVLARQYVLAWERKYGIPDQLLGRQGTLESNNHAVAQGWADPQDEGWAQIHLPYHPDFTQATAWVLVGAVKWMAGQLWSNHTNLGDYDAALAAYNTGYSTAKTWLAAGKPASGGPVWHTPQGDVDSFARAYQYVQFVRAAAY